MDTPTLAQPAYEAHAQYSAPWRDRLPDGSLSEPFGPASAAAQAAQTARARDWAWREPPRDAKRSKLSAELAGVDLGGVELSERERQVWRLVVVDGHAVRWVARELRMRRQTVQSYLARVREKAGR